MSGTGKFAVIALGIIVIILFISFGLTYFTMSNQINSLTIDKSNLQTQIGNLTAQNDLLRSQINALNISYGNLQTAKLVEVEIVGTPTQYFPTGPALHVTGAVVNVGSFTAYHCMLHVIAYWNAEKVIDLDIGLGTSGTISGESGVVVDSNVPYSGGGISSFTITPEWTTSY